MTNETKVRLLTIILNAGIKGTDREMLDNLKGVIKSIKSENEAVVEVIESPSDEEKPCVPKSIGIFPKRKAGRPPKKK